MSDNGVLLVNLGTPAAPEKGAVKRFLTEFLSDPRVVDLPRWFWLPLLKLVIIPLRKRRVAEAYEAIWLDDGSPLMVYSRALCEGLKKQLQDRCDVRLAMRYGEPGVRGRLAEMQAAGVNKLLVIPLYPQYSATTTETVFDAVSAALGELDYAPELKQMKRYHDQPGWVHSIASSVRNFQMQHGKAEKLLFSMHGIPRRLVDAGDPYEQQCRQSVAAIAEVLKQDIMLVYQSRVGREEWLQPYTDEVIRQLAADGVRHIQVASPGFAVDCLETLEEIAIRYRELFLAAGGEKFEYIPALNASDEHIGVFSSIVERHFGTDQGG